MNCWSHSTRSWVVAEARSIMSPGSPLPLSSSILSELILLLRIATFLHFPCSSTKHVCLDALTELTGMESNILNKMFCQFTQKVSHRLNTWQYPDDRRRPRFRKVTPSESLSLHRASPDLTSPWSRHRRRCPPTRPRSPGTASADTLGEAGLWWCPLAPAMTRGHRGQWRPAGDTDHHATPAHLPDMISVCTPLAQLTHTGLLLGNSLEMLPEPRSLENVLIQWVNSRSVSSPNNPLRFRICRHFPRSSTKHFLAWAVLTVFAGMESNTRIFISWLVAFSRHSEALDSGSRSQSMSSSHGPLVPSSWHTSS